MIYLMQLYNRYIQKVYMLVLNGTIQLVFKKRKKGNKNLICNTDTCEFRV